MPFSSLCSDQILLLVLCQPAPGVSPDTHLSAQFKGQVVYVTVPQGSESAPAVATFFGADPERKDPQARCWGTVQASSTVSCAAAGSQRNPAAGQV